MIKKLINFGAWTVLGATFSRTANLAITALIARLVSPEEFGAFSITQNMGATLTAFATFGLATTCSKRVAELSHKENEKGNIFSFFILTSTLLAAAFSSTIIIFSNEISTQIYKNKEIQTSIVAAALLIFFSATTSVAQGGLMGAHEFRKISSINIKTSIITLTLPPIIYYLLGSTAGLFSIVAPQFISTILSLMQCKSLNLLTPSQNTIKTYHSERRTLIELTLPAALSTALVGPANWIATTILIRHSENLQSIGEYNIAYQIYAALIFIPSALASITLPLISSHSKNSITKNFITSTALTTGIAATTSLAAYIFSDAIVKIYGQNFPESSSILKLLCITVVINSINMNVSSLIASTNKMWLGFISNLMWATIYISSAIYLIPRNFGEGLALAMLIAYLSHTLVQSFIALSLIRKAT